MAHEKVFIKMNVELKRFRKTIRIARRKFRRFTVEVSRTQPLLHNGKKPR